jgi:hypothetical protein
MSQTIVGYSLIYAPLVIFFLWSWFLMPGLTRDERSERVLARNFSAVLLSIAFIVTGMGILVFGL